MQVGRTSQEEIQSLSDLFQELEQLSHSMESWSYKGFDSIDFKEEEYQIFGSHIRTTDPERALRDLVHYITHRLNWQRVLLNCLVMLEQCTDPSKDVLDHSPEIREGLELLKEKQNGLGLTKALMAAREYINEPEHQHSQSTFSKIIGRIDAALKGDRPKVFLTKTLGDIHPAFRIGNQTFTLGVMRDPEMDPKEQANWHANMLRSAFGLERVKAEDDVLLSMFNDNEPLEDVQETQDL